MNTNDILIQIHGALVDKVQSLGDAGERAKTAADIGKLLTRYANAWTEAYANDGKVDTVESDLLKKSGEDAILRLPCVENSYIELIWNGTRILWKKIPGLKSFLEERFGLKFK